MSWSNCSNVVSISSSFQTIVRHSRVEETDDPNEIIHIQQGLEQHLAIEPSVTMSVLCDQLSWTEDEQGNREQLRTLVLKFLARSIGPLNAAVTHSSDRILVEGIIDVSFLPSSSAVRFHAPD